MIKMMIADDEKMIREGILNFIDWKEHEIEVVGAASDGEQARILFEDKRPDIVITDIRMPKLMGLELMAAIRKLDDQVKVIIISGYEDFQYAQSAIKLGASDYLLKPVRPDYLVERVLELRDECWRKQDQLEDERLNHSLLEDSLPLLRERILIDLCNGQSMNHEGIQSKIKGLKLDTLFAEPHCCVAVLINPLESELGASEIEYLKLYRRIEHALQAMSVGRGEPITIRPGLYGMILRASAPAEQDRDWLEDSLSEMREALEAVGGFKYSLGIGTVFRSIYELQSSWVTALEDVQSSGEPLQLDVRQAGRNQRLIGLITTYLKEHYNEPLSLNRLAEFVYLSPNYICTLFKEETGKNITDYLVELRLEKVKELLADHELKLYEIAQQVGYTDGRYFNKIFKRMTGMSMSAYRNSH